MKPLAIITGANRGLGFETSRELAKKGIKVLMGSRDGDKGNAAAARLHDEGLDVTAVPLDVSDPESIRNAVHDITSAYEVLDILINNAGMVHPEEGWTSNSVEHLPIAAIRATFETNFFGAVDLTQQLLPLLKRSKQGRIVNVSSIAGSLTLGSDKTSGAYEVKPFAYNASKAAMNAFTIHMAAALKETDITVNSAHPGWVKTDMGTTAAPLTVSEGIKTIIDLALHTTAGYTGHFVHMGEQIPW